MSILTFLSGLVKGKALATTLVGVSLAGGTGVALAATPTGHELMSNLPGVHTTVSPTHKPEKIDADHHLSTITANTNKQIEKELAHACASLKEAQQLAAKHSLNAESTDKAIKMICSLHAGSFQITVDGKNFTTDHALGYGEIDLLLTYAKALAAKDGAKLTEDNVQKYMTTILSSCGSTSIAACVNNKINESGHGNGEKPIVIPTIPADGKPIVIPTIPADWKPTIPAIPSDK